MASTPYTEPPLDDFGVPRTALPAELQSEFDTIRWVAYHCVKFGNDYQHLLSSEINHDPRLAFLFPTHSCYQSFRQAQQLYEELKSHGVEIKSPFALELIRRLSIDGILEQREAIAKLRARKFVIDHYVKENCDLQKKVEELKLQDQVKEGQLALAFFHDYKSKIHIHDRNKLIQEKDHQLDEKDKLISDLQDALNASKKASVQLQDEQAETMRNWQKQSKASASNMVRVRQLLHDSQEENERARLDLGYKRSTITTLESRLEFSETLCKMERKKKNVLKIELQRLVQICEAWGEEEDEDDDDDDDDDDSNDLTDAVPMHVEEQEPIESEENMGTARPGSSPQSPWTGWNGLAELMDTSTPNFQRSDAPSPSSPSSSLLVESESDFMSSYPDSVG